MLINPGRTLFISCLFCFMGVAHADEAGQGTLLNDTAAFRTSERLAAERDPGAYTIDPASIEITRIEAVEETDQSYLNTSKAGSGDGLVIIDQIVNLFTKIWEIIKQNAPVVTIDTQYAAAMPQGITAWNQLAEWKKPKSYLYSFSAKNLYGAKTINVSYKVIYTYGGKYKGKGQYLTGVTVVPTAVTASWGYRFSMSAQVADSTIANVGMDQDPVASMQLKMPWKISTSLKDSNGASVYYVQGDGYFEEIASPFSGKQVVKAEDVRSAAPLLKDPVRIFE